MNWRLGARTLGKKALMSMLYPLLRPLVEAVIDADTRSIERWRYRQSLAETGRFVEEHLPSIQSLRDPAALLRLAVEHLEEEEGLVCEFGVYTGTSLNQIAALAATGGIIRRYAGTLPAGASGLGPVAAYRLRPLLIDQNRARRLRRTD